MAAEAYVHFFSRFPGPLKRLNDDYVKPWFYEVCRIRREDIIVGSFPRSGRTWVRLFVAAYISYYYRLGIEVDWDNFVNLTPGPLCNRESGLLSFPKHIRSRLIFSHDRSTGRYYSGRKVVYVTRSFLDILISLYFFSMHRNRPQYRDLDINRFVMNEFNMGEAINRINYFSRQLKKASRMLILPYERLRADPEQHFKQLIGFPNYRLDEDAFRRAIQHASFHSIRELERKKLGSVPDEGLHTRSGGIGQFRIHLEPRTITYVRSQLGRGLTGILRDHYLGEPDPEPAG